MSVRQCGRRRLHAHRARGKVLNLVYASKTQQLESPLVKVCGVVNANDAKLAATRGVDFIGTVITPGMKRSVDEETALRIADTTRVNGAQPVGVFVNESAETIERVVQECGLAYAQLHGDTSRQALLMLRERIRAIYALSVDGNGDIVTPKPAEMALEREAQRGGPHAGVHGWRKASDWVSRGRRTVDFMLLDSAVPGSGQQSCDWRKITAPKGASRRGFMLAGGLSPASVADAVRILHPQAVDVSSGVCADDGLHKDADLLEQFVHNAKNALACEDSNSNDGDQRLHSAAHAA